MAGDRSGPAMVVRPWGCSIALLDVALIRMLPPVHLARAPHPLARVPLPTPAPVLVRICVLQRAFTISVDATGTSIQRMGVSLKQSWRWRQAEQASRLGGSTGRGAHRSSSRPHVSVPFEVDASVVLRQNHGAEEPCDVALPLRAF
jgi:hypothetical protein